MRVEEARISLRVSGEGFQVLAAAKRNLVQTCSTNLRGGGTEPPKTCHITSNVHRDLGVLGPLELHGDKTAKQARSTTKKISCSLPRSCSDEGLYALGDLNVSIADDALD